MIAALVTDRILRSRLELGFAERGAAERQRTVWCGTAEALYRAVADEAVTVVITECSAQAAHRAEASVRRLREDFPTVPVLVYGWYTMEAARGFFACARAGATDVVIAGHDDVGPALADLLATTTALHITQRALARLAPVVPVEILALVGCVLRDPRGTRSVRELARRLRVHRKTLAVRCRRAGAPPPGELASWCRLVLAAERLRDPGRTANRIAQELAFGSGATLSKRLKRYTGATAAAVRVQGGGTLVLECLVERIQRGRGCRRPQPPPETP